jgi:hypothetical protein
LRIVCPNRVGPAPRRRVLTGYTMGGQINDLKEKERDI